MCSKVLLLAKKKEEEKKENKLERTHQSGLTHVDGTFAPSPGLTRKPFMREEEPSVCKTYKGLGGVSDPVWSLRRPADGRNPEALHCG